MRLILHPGYDNPAHGLWCHDVRPGEERLENLSRQELVEYAVTFVASCAERAINIASWAAALDGRPYDAAIYVEAVETLWRHDPRDVHVFSARMVQLEEMHGLSPQCGGAESARGHQGSSAGRL